MIITSTRASYDLSSASSLKKLKANISKMRSTKNVKLLLNIYAQVFPYKDYAGKSCSKKNARLIYQLLPSNLVATTQTPNNVPYAQSRMPTSEPVRMTPPAQSASENKKESKNSKVSGPAASSLQLQVLAAAKLDSKQKNSLLPYGHTEKAPIDISYRNDQGKHMHAAFYDHYLVRKITKHPTKITLAPDKSIETFYSFTKVTTTFELAIEAKDFGQKIMPEVSTNNPSTSGLLFIPGRPRDDKDTARREYEKQLLKTARNRGQPILAICAGSWQLWEAFGGKTKFVEDHCYSSMPYIVTNGGVGNNVAIHRIALQPNTFTANTMKLKNGELNPIVNSIHWEAPDESHIPNLLEISAKAIADDKIAPKSRQSAQMDPTKYSIEAFESKFGAPVLGIQWHPEAYFKNDAKKTTAEDKRHLSLINYMASAGDAYLAKRKMLTQLQEKFSQAALLEQQGIFRRQGAPSSRNEKDEKEQKTAFKKNIK